MGIASSWQCQTPYSPSNPGENSWTSVGTSWTSALQPGLGPLWIPSVWSATFRGWRRGWNGGAEVSATAVKRLLCCGVRRTAKRWDKCISVGEGYIKK
jgi:hypothetical protein